MQASPVPLYQAAFLTRHIQLLAENAYVKALTLADCDEQCDTSELETMVHQQVGQFCTSIEFRDDNHKHGCRSLEWNVTVPMYNGRADWSEDGKGADTSKLKVVVWVPVRESDTLDCIAARVVAEVKAIDGNIFA